MQTKLPFFTLLLLISFASVNAVLFTPALPDIVHFFTITDDSGQLTITWFLIGYALGQLLYGPIANRFGRKPALYIGIALQIISSLLCVLAGAIHFYGLLIAARFIVALGSGVGLKMTFTLINECYEPQKASQKISYLMLAFAITPGLGVALGGFLNTYWGWTSCFYASAMYGLILFFFVTKLPETQQNTNLNALNVRHLICEYKNQLKNKNLITYALLMGSTTSFIYVFAALAPFIIIKLFNISSDDYGVANCFPPIGLILGSLVNARLSQKYMLQLIMQKGIWIAYAGVILMFFLMYLNLPILISLFLPMIFIYFGLSLIMANASVIAMQGVSDKAHGAAMMSFLNMGTATLIVLSLTFFKINIYLLPFIYLILCIIMLVLSMTQDSAFKKAKLKQKLS